ncbi:hypothetical protein [Georgenia sp. SYP-B2076]|uniref:hypothetical protein n=1 Tax=Georgenia sp. SYP-B2076 TaxID=2495881 RepID=UPI000F8D945C|nr:hypothetical protein [Georgenia sp. SYP-B2076]
MAPGPTGARTRARERRDLAIRRAIADRPEAVWATLTDPDRTAIWFGPWTGTPGAGNTVQVGFTHEEGEATTDVGILRARHRVARRAYG